MKGNDMAQHEQYIVK